MVITLARRLCYIYSGFMGSGLLSRAKYDQCIGNLQKVKSLHLLCSQLTESGKKMSFVTLANIP